MEDIVNMPNGHIGTGSTLLLADDVALDTAEVRTSAIIDTRMISTLGLDISADQNCTVKVVRLPDGVTAGAESVLGSVVAGTPAFHTYSSLLCPAVKIVVENTGGAPMTAFSLYVRGGA